MKYQTYPAYKDSEIEWVNFLPNHWGKVKLRLQAELYAGGTPSKNIEEYWEDGTVPWINSGAVNQTTVTEPSMYITEQAFRNSSAKWIPRNALVMALAGQGKTKGMVAKLAIETTCNQSMAAIVPKKSSNSNYLFWWLTFNYQNIRNMAGGDLRDGLNLELLGNIECPTPTDEEKISIAQFLDHETAKIDTLIEKQQRLIELLKEKRQAVISHAVTKGLNPNAPMKDSGVEWLGEVPEHWKIASLSKLFNIKAGGDLKTAFFSEVQTENHPYPIYTNANDEKAVYGYTSKCNYSSNTITVSGRGEVGFAVYRDHAYDAIIRLLVLSATGTSNCKFFTYFINAVINFRVESSAIGQLSTQQISPYKVTFPSFEEQTKIVNFLDNETVKIDTLIEKSNSAIELMQERRTALISAAVTGKIDVRNWSEKQ